MKSYDVVISFIGTYFAEVEADDREDAVDKAYHQMDRDCIVNLRKNDNYCDVDES